MKYFILGLYFPYQFKFFIVLSVRVYKNIYLKQVFSHFTADYNRLTSALNVSSFQNTLGWSTIVS